MVSKRHPPSMPGAVLCNRCVFVVRVLSRVGMVAWFACVGVAAGDSTRTAARDEFESLAAARQIEKSLGTAVQRVAPAVVALDTAEILAPSGLLAIVTTTVPIGSCVSMGWPPLDRLAVLGAEVLPLAGRFAFPGLRSESESQT